MNIFKNLPETLTEDLLWEIVDACEWEKDTNYERINVMLLEKLTPDQLKQLSNFVDKKCSEISRVIRTNLKKEVDFGGDSYDDLVAHLVGLGRKKFNGFKNDPKTIIPYLDKYVESFNYAIPMKYDMEKLNKGHYTNYAHRYLNESDIQDLLIQLKGNPRLDKRTQDAIKNMVRDLELVSKGDFSVMDAPDFHPVSGYKGVASSPMYQDWEVLYREFRLHHGIPNLIKDYNSVKHILNKAGG